MRQLVCREATLKKRGPPLLPFFLLSLRSQRVISVACMRREKGADSERFASLTRCLCRTCRPVWLYVRGVVEEGVYFFFLSTSASTCSSPHCFLRRDSPCIPRLLFSSFSSCLTCLSVPNDSRGGCVVGSFIKRLHPRFAADSARLFRLRLSARAP